MKQLPSLLLVSVICSLLTLWYNVSGAVTYSYNVGHRCDPAKNPCKYLDMCSDNAPTPDGIVCSCRLFHLRTGVNMTWKGNFTNCTSNYSPWGTYPLENMKVVDEPYDQYERVPDKSITSNGDYDDNFLARYARLHFTFKGGWCAPTTPHPNGTAYYLMIDLGSNSTVSAVVTQGRANSRIEMLVSEYHLYIGLNETDLVPLNNSGTGLPHVFTGNTRNDDPVYNYISPFIVTRFLKFIPIKEKNMKCMRIDVLGHKLVDECENGWNQCDPKAKCTDTVPSYYCTCPRGYWDALGNGFKCFQINECFDPRFKHNCSAHAKCTDLDGSFKCTCFDGYHGDGYYCEDFNECINKPPADPGYWCKHKDAECINEIGSYKCQCKLGYSGKPEQCKDDNECKKENDCSRDAICTNTEGSYICVCKTGYEGDGKTCVDINECKMSPCHVDAICTNTPGSFSCVCQNGYRGSGRWCEDIDECLEQKPCQSNERCYNYNGGYVCMCPAIMPMQRKYIATEKDILDHVLSNFRNSSEDWRYPLDYHAQILRTVYDAILRTYQYHSKEVTHAFFYTKSAGNHFAVEMYDFRCSDIANVSFPNSCHRMYEGTSFEDFTDVVDMWLIRTAEIPFETWATTPVPTPAKEVVTTTGMTTTSTEIPTTIVTINGTNFSRTFPPPSTPTPYTDCKYFLNDTKGGSFRSPNYPNNYPPNALCTWTIEAPEGHSVYIHFHTFEMEDSKNCYYDNVEIRDEHEDGKLLARFCGSGTLYKQPVRSGRRKLVVIFYSDLTHEAKGFFAIWNTLKPRASLTCITYNQMSSMPESFVKTWKQQIADETDKSQFVPISRLLACKQYPRCNHSRPGDVIFTLQHIRTDRNVKRCIHWMLDKIGTSYSDRPCKLIKTNKTHTVCSCHSWGIVAVLGKFSKWSPYAAPSMFKLGQNSFLSVLFVAIALFFTLLYLFLKDQWGAVILEVFTMKEYDSGRIIQMHIVCSTLLAEIFFSIITFNITPSVGACFFMAFVFYYLLQTVFFWLFIYALFLQARVSEIFDSEKYNSYKIYLFVGYGLPFIVTLTISGLNYSQNIDEGICWLLFEGSTVWSFSGVIVTLGVGSLCLLIKTILNARTMENGIILQEKCIRTIFTQFFVLLTSVFGAYALKDRTFFAEYCFSLCNLLQGFSIAIMYCILKREDPIIRSNQVGPVPEWNTDEKFDEAPDFMDMESDGDRSEEEEEEEGGNEVRKDMAEDEEEEVVHVDEKPVKRYRYIQDGSTIFLRERKPGYNSDDEEEVKLNVQPIVVHRKPPPPIPSAPPAALESKEDNEGGRKSKMVDGERSKSKNEELSESQTILVRSHSDDESDQEIDFRFDEIEMVRREYHIDVEI